MRIGLTGGIASGKSLVADYLKEMGAYLIDYDLIAREVVEQGRPAWNDIKDHFGQEVFAPDGSIDRAQLGAIIFNNIAERRKLESITHPRIVEEAIKREQEILRDAPQAIIVHDIPLLFETGSEKKMDATIVAYTSDENQMRRLMERDGLSREEARARIAAQLPLEQKSKKAGYIIDNNGTMENTRKQVQEIYRRLLKRAGNA